MGTAITIIAVLLILLVAPRGQGRGLLRRYPVCDQTMPAMLSGVNYCGDCGSKV